MPKLTGVFETFKDLDRIPVPDINHWLKAKEMEYYIENYIGNRLLYPQTVAVTSWDMEVDLAILREYIKRHTDEFYNFDDRKLIIPEEFLPRFAPVASLVSAFLDVVKLETESTIITIKKDDNMVVAGSLICPKEKIKDDFIEIYIDDQMMKFKVGSIHLIPIEDTQVKFRISTNKEIYVPGGNIGILIDLRRKGKEEN